MKLLHILFLLSIVLGQFVSAQSSNSIGREFSSNDDFVKANSIRLPKPVLSALLASKEAVRGWAWVRDNPGRDRNFLFNGFWVNLSTTTDEKDYVAIGKVPLAGDGDWFWVVRSFSPRPRVVLFCNALTVDLLPSVHHSLQDIRCTWESPGGDGYIDDYQFDGQKYVLAKETLTQRRP
jgi:hypothetical protein